MAPVSVKSVYHVVRMSIQTQSVCTKSHFHTKEMGESLVGCATEASLYLLLYN